MPDPFRYFGISPNASRAELDHAYRQMREKYRCDKNADSLTHDISENKLREIDDFYSQALYYIDKSTAMPPKPVVKVADSSDESNNNQKENYNKFSEFENNYQQINTLINNKNFSAAEKLLFEFNLVGYAKWHYALARLRFNQGWMNEALENYKKAYELEPDNTIYRQSYINICNMRDGKIKKHSNKFAAALTFGIGSAYCCCIASSYNEECEKLSSCCLQESGIYSTCCTPCGDGIDAYCNSQCHVCCGGCPG